MDESKRKRSGAYYTPDDIAASLVKWVVRSDGDRLLDPACGDGRFIAQHRNSVGIEQHLQAAQSAMQRAPWSLVHEGDFFSWARNTTERFQCAAGNPPFIRYQTFSGKTREDALSLCANLGASFSGLTSSWAPFLVATAHLLEAGGKMAFVVPAEIGHAPYAAPLLEYLVRHFGLVHVVAVKEKLFPDLSEDCWLLYAQNFGRSAAEICFSAIDFFRPSATPPLVDERVSVTEWRDVWNRRLRPFLVSSSVRELYREVARRPDTFRFGDFAAVGIGYVSGDNDFFHLRPSTAAELRLPNELLLPSVRNGRVLPSHRLTNETVEKWRSADDAILLLRIPKSGVSLPRSVKRYLDSAGGERARASYKCRNREPWYSVPDVQVPDFFLTYMSGREVYLVRNEARCTCTNSVHSVRLKTRWGLTQLAQRWGTTFAQLSCELEGHPLGGGLLKLEPREAAAVLLPDPLRSTALPADLLMNGIATMQAWRHYGRA